jgi:6-phosphogluconolactonase
MNTKIFESAAGLGDALAARVREALESAGAPVAAMLAGGRTPLAAYAQLGASPVSGAGRVFLSDERMAPADSADSNAFQIGPLLAAAGIGGDRFLRVDTSRSLESAAAGYDRALAKLVADGVRIPFGLLGVGADGHTASLFSLEDVEASRVGGRYVVPVRRPSPPDRISATPHLLALVEELVFVVTGADKAEVVRRLMSAPSTLPAGLAVAGHPNVALWADRAAIPG